MRNKKLIAVFIVAAAVAAGVLSFARTEIASAGGAGGRSVLDFKMRDIDGKDVKLNKYKGNVLLVVNTASKCGYTPQYEGLESIYTKYKDKGFYVLGFPANNFGAQEPGTEAEIKE